MLVDLPEQPYPPEAGDPFHGLPHSRVSSGYGAGVRPQAAYVNVQTASAADRLAGRYERSRTIDELARGGLRINRLETT